LVADCVIRPILVYEDEGSQSCLQAFVAEACDRQEGCGAKSFEGSWERKDVEEKRGEKARLLEEQLFDGGIHNKSWWDSDGGLCFVAGGTIRLRVISFD
jgi:hypothetical protein